ncbi:MAG TPA: SDR family oxidoreductase, partial [Candidatus Deferrimicrobiaceae bacterium]
RLFLFGYGYCANHFLRAFGDSLDRATATVTSVDRADALSTDRLELLPFSSAGSDPRIPGRIAESDALLVSIPPGERGDPALRAFRDAILRSRPLSRIVYLSTIGVYGDHGGGWVDETTACIPTNPRNVLRLEAESDWRSLGSESGKAVHVLRLGGIYGPGRNALEDVRNGTARRIVKPGAVFNRIHVEDAARTIAACLAHPGPGGVWNVVDDEPSPPQDVVAYAASLAGVEPPPETPFETAELSPMARSFYADSRRCSNRALKRELGVTLAFPTYREGLRALA